ncbi:MAG: hypothetical protein R3F19_26930 [Verrucomicrobiales bacterium]
MFERNTRGLGAEERRVLGALGLLARAPVPLGAVAVVCESEETARTALKRLIRRSLLRRATDLPDHWEFTHALGYRFARPQETADSSQLAAVAQWFTSELARNLGTDRPETALVTIVGILPHASALLRLDLQQELWTPLATSLLYLTAERLTELGRLDLVDASLNAVTAWLAQIPEEAANRETVPEGQPHWLRERSVPLDKLGELDVARGYLDSAASLFSQSKDIRERLALADPGNAGWQRDVAVSHFKLFQLAQKRGDEAAQAKARGECLAVLDGMRQRGMHFDPEMAQVYDWLKGMSGSGA